MAKENNKGVSKATEKNTEKKTAKKAVKSIPTMPFEDVLHLSQAICKKSKFFFEKQLLVILLALI